MSDSNSHYVLLWTSKGLSSESIKPPTAPNNKLIPELYYQGTKQLYLFLGPV